MEIRLDSRAIREAINATAELLAELKVALVLGDRLSLAALSVAEPIQPSLVGAATSEDDGMAMVLRLQPDLLICSSDLETGYGINLLQRVKTELPTTRLLIFLEHETKESVQEAMEAFADGVMFKSSLCTGEGDFVQALQAVAQGEVYFPEAIRAMAVPPSRKPDLPPLVEELTPRELDVVSAVARGLSNTAIAKALGTSVETVKTHVTNAMDKLGVRNRTQLAVSALLYELIDPLP